MVTVGFVGAGTIAGYHRAALVRTPGIDLVGVTDAVAATAQRRAAEWGVHAWPDVDTALADDEVDAVYVLTPHRFHTDIALRAIEAGKHVLVEKPVATTPDEIEALVRAAEVADTVVMPGHNYSYVPEFQRLVRLVHSGDLGHVRDVSITYAMRHPDGYATRVGGALEDLFVHPTYLAVALLGRPTRVMAGTSGDVALGTEEQAWVTLEAERAWAHLFCTFAVDDHSSDPWTFSVQVVGSAGSTSLNWRDATIGHSDNPNHSIGLPIFEETFEHEAVAFRDAVRGIRPPMSSVADAAAAWDVLAAARRSIAGARMEAVS